jgi:uncharacterized protein YbdZ (MbtH family)
MKNPFDDESSDSFALINAEGQHSLVPPLPIKKPTTDQSLKKSKYD